MKAKQRPRPLSSRCRQPGPDEEKAISQPERNLYKISTDRTHSMKFVGKAKGMHGDVVVRWYERGDRYSDMPDEARHVAGQGYIYLFPQE